MYAVIFQLNTEILITLIKTRSQSSNGSSDLGLKNTWAGNGQDELT